MLCPQGMPELEVLMQEAAVEYEEYRTEYEALKAKKVKEKQQDLFTSKLDDNSGPQKMMESLSKVRKNIRWALMVISHLCTGN